MWGECWCRTGPYQSSSFPSLLLPTGTNKSAFESGTSEPGTKTCGAWLWNRFCCCYSKCVVLWKQPGIPLKSWQVFRHRSFGQTHAIGLRIVLDTPYSCCLQSSQFLRLNCVEMTPKWLQNMLPYLTAQQVKFGWSLPSQNIQESMAKTGFVSCQGKQSDLIFSQLLTDFILILLGQVQRKLWKI